MTPTAARTSPAAWWHAVSDIAIAFLTTRLLLIGVALSHGVSAVTLHDAIGPSPPVTAQSSWLERHAEPLLAMGVQWDSFKYLDIAARGYAAPLRVRTGDLFAEFRAPLPNGVYDMRPNFFPAYPFAIRLATPLVGNAVLAALLIANAAFLIGLWCLYACTAGRFSPSVARRAVWIVCALPTSFYFSSVYAESLLLAALTMAWWAVDRGRWQLGGVALALAVFARPTGIFGSVLAISAMRTARQTGQSWVRAAAPLLVWPALAAIGYLIFAGITFGEPLATFRTQADTRLPLNWPWVPFVEAWQYGLYWSSYKHNLLDGLLAVPVVLSLPFVFVQLGIVDGLLATGLVVFPLASGLISYSRMLLPGFPIFVWLGKVAGHWGTIVFVCASLALQAYLFALFAAGKWIA